MNPNIHHDDEIVLTFARQNIRKIRDSLNMMSDEYSLMSETSLQIAKVGERINPVLVALDELLEAT